MSFDLEKKEAKPFMEGVATYAIAAKGEKVAVMKEKGEIFVVDAASPPGDLSEAKVKLDDLVIELDPREEWDQIFWEAWREQRDFFWDAGDGRAGLEGDRGSVRRAPAASCPPAAIFRI